MSTVPELDNEDVLKWLEAVRPFLLRYQERTKNNRII
jgi:hypothetical protein